MSSLQGADGLKARLKALRKDVFKPAADDWASVAAQISRESVPNRNTRWSKGTLHDSIDIKRTKTGRVSSTTHKAVVVGKYTAYFVDHGVVPHSLITRKSRPKGKLGRTIFARAARKRHPGYAARPFRHRALMEAYKRHPALDYAIEAWNRAA